LPNDGALAESNWRESKAQSIGAPEYRELHDLTDLFFGEQPMEVIDRSDRSGPITDDYIVGLKIRSVGRTPGLNRGYHYAGLLAEMIEAHQASMQRHRHPGDPDVRTHDSTVSDKPRSDILSSVYLSVANSNSRGGRRLK
jgi:hypothetical protein